MKYEIWKEGSQTYYNAGKWFPKKIRDEVATLYAYVRSVDDFVDNNPPYKKAFSEWKSKTLAALNGEKTGNKIIDDYIKLTKKRHFDDKWTLAFLESMEFDLKGKKCENFKQTLQYIHGSAEVIGLMLCRIFELPKEADKYAIKLGQAFQYINMIRDINEDNNLGRQYLPVPKGLKNLTKPKQDEKLFSEHIRKQIDLYNEWFEEAQKGFKYIPKKYLIAVKTAADGYDYTAKEIYKNPMIIFETKVKPSKSFLLRRGLINSLK